MTENRSEGLLIRAEPIGLAQQLCCRLIEGARITDGALLLAVDPAWAGAISTDSIVNVVRVNDPHTISAVLAADAHGSRPRPADKEIKGSEEPS